MNNGSLQNGVTFPGGALPVNGAAGAAVQLQAGTLVGTVATPVGNPYVATPGTAMAVQWASVSTTQCAIYANNQILVPPGGGSATINGSISLGVINSATQVVAICSAANGTTTAAQVSIQVGAGNSLSLTVDNAPALNATVPVNNSSQHFIAWTAPGATMCELQTASGAPLAPTSPNSFTVQAFAQSQGYVLICTGYPGGGSVVGGVYLLETGAAIGALPTVILQVAYQSFNSNATATANAGSAVEAVYGSNISVQWTSTNAAFCQLQATGLLTPVPAGQNSPFNTPAISTASFTITCTANNGAVTSPQMVTVTVPPGTPVTFTTKNSNGSSPAESLWAVDAAGLPVLIGGNQYSNNSTEKANVPSVTVPVHLTGGILHLQGIKDKSGTVFRDTANGATDTDYMYFCIQSVNGDGTVTYKGEIDDNDDGLPFQVSNLTSYADTYFELTLPAGVAIQNITLNQTDPGKTPSSQNCN